MVMAYHKLKTAEVAGTYDVESPVTEADILKMARQLSRRRLARGRTITHPEQTCRYLQVLLKDYEYEVFGALFLDNHNRVIRFVELFRGTLDAAGVYPREVIKIALADNVAAMILVHNHPSGNPEPSEADRRITERLHQALDLMGIRLLDHVVVGVEGYVSFAARGYLL